MGPDKGRVLKWIGFGGLAVALVLVKLFVLDLFIIPQNGMFPSLPAGKRFLCWRHPYSSPGKVRRGDVVVFTQDVNGKRYQFIWRVIGLPGDHVEINGENVTINDKPLQHQHVRTYPGGTILRESDGMASYEIAIEQNPAHPPPPVDVKVAAGQFFLLGDNRESAADSRYQGPIAFDEIIAKKW